MYQFFLGALRAVLAWSLAHPERAMGLFVAGPVFLRAVMRVVQAPLYHRWPRLRPAVEALFAFIPVSDLWRAAVKLMQAFTGIRLDASDSAPNLQALEDAAQIERLKTQLAEVLARLPVVSAPSIGQAPGATRETVAPALPVTAPSDAASGEPAASVDPPGGTTGGTPPVALVVLLTLSGLAYAASLNVAAVLLLGFAGCHPILPPVSGCAAFSQRCSPAGIPEVCSATQRWEPAGEIPCSSAGGTCTVSDAGVALCLPNR